MILFFIKIQEKIISFKEEEEKSSHYGLYILGFTCATRVKTTRYYNEN